jgi:hypothetical protein
VSLRRFQYPSSLIRQTMSVIKVALGDDVRRVRFDDPSTMTYEALRSIVTDAFPTVRRGQRAGWHVAAVQCWSLCSMGVPRGIRARSPRRAGARAVDVDLPR